MGVATGTTIYCSSYSLQIIITFLVTNKNIITRTNLTKWFNSKFIEVTIFSVLTDVGGLDIRYVQNRAVVESETPIGTFIFRSIMDGSVITVQPNGEVTTEVFNGSPEQKWTVVAHPLDSYALEFKQEVVPYNTLSGYEDPPDNPGIFPRPLGLANRGNVEHVVAWNILIRGRWCIQANGYGRPMDMDDCEYFVAPWQLWELEEVTP